MDDAYRPLIVGFAGSLGVGDFRLKDGFRWVMKMRPGELGCR